MRKDDISFSSYSFIHNLECFFSQLYWFFCSQNLSDYQVLGSLLFILMSKKILKFPCIEKNQYFWSENFGGNFVVYLLAMGFPGGSVSKESACNAGDLGWEDPLEKEMATWSSILAWRIPWTEEPGGLQSMGHKELDMTEWFSLLHFFFFMY